MVDVGRPDSPNSFQRAQLGSPDSVKVEFDRAASPRLHRRRPFSRGGRRPARAPEPWEEMLDLVPAPPPPPVTGGVRTFDQLPSGEIQSRGNKEPVLRADWTIRRLKVDMKTVQVKYRSLLVPAGQYISSAHFRLGSQTFRSGCSVVAVLPDYEVPCQLMMKQVEGAMSFHLGVFALQGLNGVCKQHSYA
ncbi:hypothetical protein AK812_SmicGene18327 [Symbiodinium microadriaticum]|uniref:Uncharacterized protein n=1 Tax=Symbiodinium microadriaticum TaxID=2951 RepID=A0A1Q9DVJ9_SYMMI|nr:hypothetical protein AK812_SmicGene18327 [Symbiodinium microadriaticum]